MARSKATLNRRSFYLCAPKEWTSLKDQIQTPYWSWKQYYYWRDKGFIRERGEGKYKEIKILTAAERGL